MGSVVSTAANGVGTFLGNALAAPFRTLFGGSCEGVCSGIWDLGCFIEHLCVLSLVRLIMVILLTYIMLVFVYLLCKLGIIKCVAKNACKMVWKTCSGSCRAVGGACCFLLHKVRNTKRVYRGRRRDVEEGELSTIYADDTGSSSSSSSSSNGDRGSVAADRWRGRSPSVRERRKDRLRRSLRLRRLNSKEEHAMRSRGSGRVHRHVSKLRVAEASSQRVHGHGSARYGRARVHRVHEG